VTGSLVALLATWRGRLIATVVVAQLLLPLRYYACSRDPHDERFAWRMFSPMMMTRCRSTVVDRGRSVALAREFHEAWLELAQRGRFGVVEAMAAELCRRRAGAAVTVTLDCTYVDRPPATYVSGGDGLMHRRDADELAADVCEATR
jgi:hypothetical protein